MVEHRRLELLTPTLPVLCATSCANAPRTENNIAHIFRFVKCYFSLFQKNVLILHYFLLQDAKR